MTRQYIFADEAGCLEFAKNGKASKYFILTTISIRDCSVGAALTELRRELVWNGEDLKDFFHATEDKQAVRDRVFDLICKHDFQVQATVMEKSKAQPHIRSSRPNFYQYGWYYHFKFGTAPKIGAATELMVVAASIGTKKERAGFSNAVKAVLKQTLPKVTYQSNFCPAAADPCLQVVDYCAWAIQRKWERADARSYDLIKDRITYEYDLWKVGTKHYY